MSLAVNLVIMKGIAIDWSALLQWLNTFALTFVPLFIVVDPFGNLPFIISLSEGLDTAEKRRTIDIAVLTATIIGLVFLLLGSLIISLMGITVGSFAIAGGLILTVLSVRYMTTGHMIEVIKGEMVAVVPIGTPLIVGPATITTLILLTSQFPIWLVLFSFVLIMLVTWVIFLASGPISRFVGTGGLRALSRVLALLLAAIGVNMVIRGLYMLEIIGSKATP